MVVRPWDTPTTSPVNASIVATDVSLVDHVPPASPLVVNGLIEPTTIKLAPAIVPALLLVSIVKFKVTILSQPVTDCNVSVYVPVDV